LSSEWEGLPTVLIEASLSGHQWSPPIVRAGHAKSCKMERSGALGRLAIPLGCGRHISGPPRGPCKSAPRRVLDFGAGCGASTMVLARLEPPSTEIVGVELGPQTGELARHRASFHGVTDRVSFHLSPDPDHLPPGIGQFDCMMLSAVYEHLLPGERKTLLPMLWSALRRDGVMFVNQSPYRWFPVEEHTTGLPLINYLPARLTLAWRRRFSH